MLGWWNDKPDEEPPEPVQSFDIPAEPLRVETNLPPPAREPLWSPSRSAEPVSPSIRAFMSLEPKGSTPIEEKVSSYPFPTPRAKTVLRKPWQ